MAQLKLLDADKAKLFSFESTDTQAAQDELTKRGWTNAEALAHIDAAVRAGAYAKVENKTKKEGGQE